MIHCCNFGCLNGCSLPTTAQTGGPCYSRVSCVLFSLLKSLFSLAGTQKRQDSLQLSTNISCPMLNCFMSRYSECASNKTASGEEKHIMMHEEHGSPVEEAHNNDAVLQRPDTVVDCRQRALHIVVRPGTEELKSCRLSRLLRRLST